jgi:hypothetical protein
MPESLIKPEVNNEKDNHRSDAAENVKVFESFRNATFMYLSKLSCANSSVTRL